jgi:Fe-S oxidoreductase
MNPRVKCYWVVEGDIHGCFDEWEKEAVIRREVRRLEKLGCKVTVERAAGEGACSGEVMVPLGMADYVKSYVKSFLT